MTLRRTEQAQPSKKSSDRKAVTGGGQTNSTNKKANGTMSSNSTNQENPVNPMPDIVPDIVKRSIEEAHVEPEAAANPEAVEEKKEVEQVIKDEFRDTNEYQDPSTTSEYQINGARRNESQGVGAYPDVTENGDFGIHSQPERVLVGKPQSSY